MTTDQTSNAHNYVLGHSEGELTRLERQAVFFSDVTRAGLLRAGIRPGMRVLDLGCGVGDVSLIASGVVGESGHVTGIDISEGAIGIARARAGAAGNTHVDFQLSTIDSFADYGSFDAVTGRFILLHIPDPVAMLKGIVARVKKNTPIVFLEMDLSSASAVPPTPLFELSVRRVMEVYRRMGLEPDSGSKLYSIFRAAGLEPELTGSTRVGSRLDVAGFAFLAESLRSLLPAIEKLGIATAGEIDIDTLRDRLIAEATAADPVIFFPRFVAGWARS